LKKHVGGNFKHYNTKKHHLIPEINIRLGDFNVGFEAGCERAGEIHTVKLEDE
jgi:hypothetical protein